MLLGSRDCHIYLQKCLCMHIYIYVYIKSHICRLSQCLKHTGQSANAADYKASIKSCLILNPCKGYNQNFILEKGNLHQEKGYRVSPNFIASIKKYIMPSNVK
jgi:hypothetical protein